MSCLPFVSVPHHDKGREYVEPEGIGMTNGATVPSTEQLKWVTAVPVWSHCRVGVVVPVIAGTVGAAVAPVAKVAS